jgi:hypothetical protein
MQRHEKALKPFAEESFYRIDREHLLEKKTSRQGNVYCRNPKRAFKPEIMER